MNVRLVGMKTTHAPLAETGPGANRTSCNAEEHGARPLTQTVQTATEPVSCRSCLRIEALRRSRS